MLNRTTLQFERPALTKISESADADSRFAGHWIFQRDLHVAAEQGLPLPVFYGFNRTQGFVEGSRPLDMLIGVRDVPNLGPARIP